MFEHCVWKSGHCCSSARYVNRGGEQTFIQPTTSQHAWLYAFVFEGALANLQQLCDRNLNAPARGRIHYRPATHFVLVTFGKNPELRSQDPSQKGIGYVGEHEAMVWVLTMAGHQLGPFFWVDHLAWFTPYMFVDSSYAMATGREVYGYPKQWGWFELPEEPKQFDHLKVAADVFTTFSPTVGATRKTVISIARLNHDDPMPVPRIWRTQQACLQGIAKELFEPEKATVIPGLGFPFHLFSELLKGAVPFVFLKQFRDVNNGKIPCYQAITEANTTLANFRGGGLLRDPFKARIANFASHPLVNDLGLGSHAPPVKLAFWLDFDFVTEPGKEVVRII